MAVVRQLTAAQRGSASAVPIAPSRFRPPWLEMTIPATAPRTLISAASCASNGELTPLSTIGRSLTPLIHSMSSQLILHNVS